jgi:hypothetical protein
MRLGPWCVTVSTLLTLGLAAHARAQVLEGRVMEEGRILPIAGADVVLLGRDGAVQARTASDDSGRFMLEPPGAGEYYVHAERLGYAATRSPLLLLGSEGHRAFEILLTPRPVGLEGFEVRVEPEAEEHLRLLGFTPADLRQRWISRDELDDAPLSADLLTTFRWQGIAGVQLKDMGPEGPELCVMFAPWTRCAAVYYNGVRMHGGEALYLGASELDAIAILRPVEAATFFGTDGGDGAVLLWTRRGRR